MAHGNGIGRPYFFKGPAGAGAGVAGVQAPRFQAGLPHVALPGLLNAREAAQHRQLVAGSTPAFPPVDPARACEIQYLARVLCLCLGEMFANIQTAARRPSHIDVPYSGVCFDRHRGSGPVGSTDPPLTLPAVGAAGPFTTVLDFTVPTGHNGVLKCWGVDATPSPAGNNVEWLLTVNGNRVAPFDTFYGSVPAALGGWFGPPFTPGAPGELCINLFPEDVVLLLARNTLAVGAIDVEALLCGWIYPPIIQTDERTIRGTIADSR